jgi:hypothetical protein
MEMNDDLKDFIEKTAHGTEGEMPSGDFDFLKELGLTEDQMKALIAKLPRIANEFIQGGAQYAEEERQLISMYERITKQISDLLMQNINASRNFFLTLATLSLTLIGAVISVRAAYPTFFKGTIALDFGMGLLAVCIIASVLYLLNRLSVENNNLTKSLALQQSGMASLLNLMRSHFLEMKPFEEYFAARKALIEENKIALTAFDKKVKKQSKLITHAPAVIGYSFLVGLAFIAFAFLF